MKVRELLKSAKENLKGEDVALAAEVLLAYVLNWSKEELFVNGDAIVSAKDLKLYQQLANRYSEGEPVAYLTNNKEFFGLDFYVDRNVLIPRPETEILVEMVMEFVRKEAESDELYQILDIGTGCGNIAVSLAKNLESVHLTAVDISANAIEIAKRNAAANGVGYKVDFAVSNLLENVKGDYEVVVANLPYIGEVKNRFVSKEALDYEPHQALFGGEDGLSLYEKLFKQMVEKTLKPKLLLGEFGFMQGEDMRGLLNKYFEQEGWSIEKDLASIERIFVVRFS